MKSVTDKRILVIGGAGYIGSVLVRHLLAENNEVVVLDNLIYDNIESISNLLTNPNFSFIQGDFCENNSLNKAMANVSGVVLLAALVGDPLCKKYPDEARRVNEAGVIDLLNQLKNYSINKFIFLSTCSNYGLRETEKPATEEASLNPKSLYAETKVLIEKYLIENSQNLNYNWTILRSATAFGLSPRMRFDLTISEFTRELTLGKELLVYDENTWRPYCHVDDISDVIIKVIKASMEKVSGQIFNVGSNAENFTKKNIVDMISAKLDKVNVKYEQGGRDPRNYKVNFDKVTNTLDFKAKKSVDESISELINKIRAGEYIDIDSRSDFFGNYSLKL